MNKASIIFTMEIMYNFFLKLHLLFVHNDNNSNNDKIGQVVVMGGSKKT
jgi:hypothetical protein